MTVDLETKFKNADTIYFVCSGNIIRSSYAELYAKHRGMGNTASYGTTYHNSTIHSRSEQKLKEIGVAQELLDDFSPTHIDEIDHFSDTDMHVVMTAKHRNQLIDHGIAPDQIVKVKEIIGEHGDVKDPYFEGNYEEAYSTITRAVSQIDSFLT